MTHFFNYTTNCTYLNHSFSVCNCYFAQIIQMLCSDVHHFIRNKHITQFPQVTHFWNCVMSLNKSQLYVKIKHCALQVFTLRWQPVSQICERWNSDFLPETCTHLPDMTYDLGVQNDTGRDDMQEPVEAEDTRTTDTLLAAELYQHHGQHLQTIVSWHKHQCKEWKTHEYQCQKPDTGIQGGTWCRVQWWGRQCYLPWQGTWCRVQWWGRQCYLPWQGTWCRVQWWGRHCYLPWQGTWCRVQWWGRQCYLPWQGTWCRVQWWGRHCYLPWQGTCMQGAVMG